MEEKCKSNANIGVGVTETGGSAAELILPDSSATVEDPFGLAPFSMPEVLRDKAVTKKSGGKA